jgi:lipopolysaccharide export system protein LptA
VLIVQDKIESDGSITKNVGRARKAHYNAVTGDIILIGSPSVQQGISVCIAQEDDTVMTLNRNGRMRVEGKHKTVIKESSTSEARR